MTILFLGIIGSGRYGQKQSVSLPLNQLRIVLGYELTYNGTSVTQDGKTKFIINIQHSGSKATLEPVMFESSYNNSVMRNPDYLSYWTKDFYIEPVSLEEDTIAQPQNIVTLTKDESQFYGPMMLTFKRFDMGEHGKSDLMVNGAMTIGADTRG